LGVVVLTDEGAAAVAAGGGDLGGRPLGAREAVEFGEGGHKTRITGRVGGVKMRRPQNAWLRTRDQEGAGERLGPGRREAGQAAQMSAGGTGVEAQDKAADGDNDDEEHQQGRSKGGGKGDGEGGDEHSNQKTLKEKAFHAQSIQRLPARRPTARSPMAKKRASSRAAGRRVA